MIPAQREQLPLPLDRVPDKNLPEALMSGRLDTWGAALMVLGALLIPLGAAAFIGSKRGVEHELDESQRTLEQWKRAIEERDSKVTALQENLDNAEYNKEYFKRLLESKVRSASIDFEDRICDNAADGEAGEVHQDFSAEHKRDSLVVRLTSGCWSGYVILPEYWRTYRLLAGSDDVDWWVAYLWLPAPGYENGGATPPLLRTDMPSPKPGAFQPPRGDRSVMIHAHRIRLQGVGLVQLVRTE